MIVFIEIADKHAPLDEISCEGKMCPIGQKSFDSLEYALNMS